MDNQTVWLPKNGKRATTEKVFFSGEFLTVFNNPKRVILDKFIDSSQRRNFGSSDNKRLARLETKIKRTNKFFDNLIAKLATIEDNDRHKVIL